MKKLSQVYAPCLLCSLLVLISLCSCAPRWQLAIADVQGVHVVGRDDWAAWRKAFPDDVHGRGDLALERVLATVSGFPLESLEIAGTSYSWQAVRSDSWLKRDGQVCLSDDCYDVSELRMVWSANQPVPTFCITGLAPTIASALNSPSPEKTSGRALGTFGADQVLLVFVDGLNYERAIALRGAKTMPFLDTLGMPQPMLTAYPGEGAVPLAAALTGAVPLRNGIVGGSSRKLQAETIFDVLAGTGRSAVLIETHDHTLDMPDDALARLPGEEDRALSLASAEVGNGESVLVVLRLASLDREIRVSGPQSGEYLESINKIDEQLARLVIQLPEGTLVLITSGYGLESAQDTGSASGGSSLLFRNMVVPLWVVQT